MELTFDAMHEIVKFRTVYITLMNWLMNNNVGVAEALDGDGWVCADLTYPIGSSLRIQETFPTHAEALKYGLELVTKHIQERGIK